ncbi:MAG: DUF2157 domain-containing protein [Bryobacteraceae bacterium]
MSAPQPGKSTEGDRAAAQQAADRVRLLREELASEEVQAVLALTPEQRNRFDEWSRARLAALAERFDVDTSASQKRMSWAMRITSTLGGLALCAAVVLLFIRYWGFLETSAQLAIVIVTPLILLGATEFTSRRERTGYFTGLLALVTLASFIMNLAVVGDIFNIVSTERALLAWGTLAMLLAYRYRLRLMLAIGLFLLVGYTTAAFAAEMGYRWVGFHERPEHYIFLGLILFGAPLVIRHVHHSDFPPVYRLLGALTFFTAILSLAELGASSYLPWSTGNIERFYEISGLLLAASAIWLGIARAWNGIVNTGAVFFVVFLFTRLYHWWWDWLPRYLFFAIIGGLSIALVWAFRQLRTGWAPAEGGIPR